MTESFNPYHAPPGPTEGRVLDFDERLSTCPRCGGPTEQGFANSNTEFTPREKVRHAVVVAEALSKPTWWSRLLSVRIKYFRAHLCRACGCYLVDTSHVVSYPEAQRLARRD